MRAQGPHILALHVWPLPHTVPHMPQFVGSLVVSTQAPPQSVVPPMQFAAQAPLEQTWPPGQMVPHMPQLLESI